MRDKDTPPPGDWRTLRRLVTVDGEIVVVTPAIFIRPCERCGVAMLCSVQNSAQRFCSRSCSARARPANTYAALLERLHSRIARGEPGACWPFTGKCDADGYGLISWKRRSRRATRVLWESLHGSIAPGLVVRHRCDQPGCCNPAHLQLGTPSENVGDAVKRGRMARGDRSPRRRYPERFPLGEQVTTSRLDAAKVYAMRAAHVAGEANYRQLALRYGVSPPAARKAVLGLSWRHLK